MQTLVERDLDWIQKGQQPTLDEDRYLKILNLALIQRKTSVERAIHLILMASRLPIQIIIIWLVTETLYYLWTYWGIEEPAAIFPGIEHRGEAAGSLCQVR